MTPRSPMPLRARRARSLAWATAATILALCAAVAVWRGRGTTPIVAAPRPVVDSALAARGAVVYDQLGCARCHALGGRGNPAAPLDAAAVRLGDAGLRDWIVAAPSVEGRLPDRAAAAKARYRSIPEPEMKALIAYLRTGATSLAPEP